MSAVSRLDAVAGKAVERLVVAHHRRRLRRIGRLDALDAPAGGWAQSEPPPRSGNAVEVLIDGAEALPRIADAIEGAQQRVWIAGWLFSADFALRPDGTMLRDLLAAAAERVDVRVLAWAGSPLPLFRPDRADAREARDALARGTRIRMELDARERPMHCHHEKVVVVDRDLAFVGGIDLTAESGNRWDLREHPVRGAIGWHDATAALRGPVAHDVASHFALRWREVSGEPLETGAAADPAGELDVQLVRTVPEHIYDALPRGELGILESYLRALRAARELVYLENQFLWSPEVVAVLADKLRRPPTDAFRVVVLLPTRANAGQEDTRGQLGVLTEADAGAGRLLACTLLQRGDDGAPVYVHAKIGIVDDCWLTLGSANLNEHSLFNDTEVNVVVRDPGLARRTRLRLWAEHLECDEADIDGPAAEIVDGRWRPLAEEGLARRRRGDPLEHRLVRLPDASRRAASLLGPINGLLVDG
jgi:phosphatidylserine/phosphatidylglycerophosphate/cardiolipin synthase-like enzyme